VVDVDVEGAQPLAGGQRGLPRLQEGDDAAALDAAVVDRHAGERRQLAA
jgi:hypothetical protein